MSAQRPVVQHVVHHHHYYGAGPTSRPAPMRPHPSRPPRRGPSPVLYVLGGVLAVVAVVVAVAVATTLLVVGGGTALLVLFTVREYVRMSRAVPPAPPRRQLSR